MAIKTNQNLNPQNKVFAFGHGGMGDKYKFPMNSMESLKHVLAIGAGGTEMDLQLTKDNQFVLYHGGLLEDETTGKGKIRDKTWAEIEKINYRNLLARKTKLILMKDFFDAIDLSNERIYTFDCKVEAKEEEDFLNNFSDALYQFIVDYKLEKKCFIESYNLQFLKRLSSKNSDLKLFVHSDTYLDGLDVARQVKLYGITIDRLKITKQEIDLAHQINLHITLYNMTNTNQNSKAIDMGADYLQSDKMENAIQLCK